MTFGAKEAKRRKLLAMLDQRVRLLDDSECSDKACVVHRFYKVKAAGKKGDN